MPSTPLLPLFAITALLALAVAGILLVTGEAAPQLAAHLAFALGTTPLILAAMGYFVPVLTRSGAAATAWAPSLALGGGILAVFSFANDFSGGGLALAAFLSGLAAGGLCGWTVNRSRNMLGPRHRGLDWYLAALGFLVLALVAVLLMPLVPGQRNALRLFHLHANLLGFVGLTALGTLQVLLPTCIGQPDPDALLRLRQDLRWAVTGTLLIAVGAAMGFSQDGSLAWQALALPGAVFYCGVILRMLMAWRSRFGQLLFQVNGAGPSLASAALGLLGLTLLGMAHGFGWRPARPAVAGFVVAFLLPLVSGAVGHLLPTWLRPGVQTSWHHVLRTRLCLWGGVRGMALLLAGLLIAGIA